MLKILCFDVPLARWTAEDIVSLIGCSNHIGEQLPWGYTKRNFRDKTFNPFYKWHMMRIFGPQIPKVIEGRGKYIPQYDEFGHL